MKNPRGLRDEQEGRGLSSSLSRDEKQQLQRQQGGSVALCVAVYRWSEGYKAGLPARDWIWWSGFAASAIQLRVSAIPLGLYGDWSVLLITACGTLLAYASGSLPQWRQEKWHARKQKQDVGLTLGNGSKHVVVVLGSDGSLDLEDLAGG